jgi:hypothetical protein
MAGGCGVGCGSGFMFEFDELVLMSLAALPSAFCVCKCFGCPSLPSILDIDGVFSADEL